MSMTTISTWIYAVKEVYSSFYCFQNIGRCTYSHKVGWLIFRKEWNHFFKNMVHFLVGLTNSKTANSIAVKVHIGNPLGMLYSDIIKDRSLIDSKKKLIRINRILKAV